MAATRWVRLLAAAALLLGAAGCYRHCAPEPLASARDRVDLCMPPGAHEPVSAELVRAVEAEYLRQGAGRHPPCAGPYHFLALSGGGFFGAFGVGVLSGWTETGTRPTFDAVTGISTGGLMATFAFLGPRYDAFLRANLVGVRRRDIMRLRFPPAVPLARSLYSPRRLARRIERAITAEVLAEVAQAHAEGRRLYVATTALDAQRLIMWDMGEIASRGTPQALALYRAVVLASAAVPGVFPPVKLPLEIDGHCYDELHVDGGTSDGAIFRAFLVGDRNRLAGGCGAWAPPGSTLHVIINGKLYAEPDCVKRFAEILTASGNSMAVNKTRDELYRIYLNCLQTGVDFRVTAVPRELHVSDNALDLTPCEQVMLYEAGYQIGLKVVTGEGWRDLPPGVEPAEQAMPRAGTRFASDGDRDCRPPDGGQAPARGAIIGETVTPGGSE